MDLTPWLLYFATVLVNPCPKLTTGAPPPAARRQPLMIEAQTSREVLEVLSFRWFQPYNRLTTASGIGKGPRVELDDKGKVNLPHPIFEFKPAVQSQAPDVVHPPTLATVNSLHLVDYIDESWSEIISPNQPRDPSLTFHPETSSTKADSSHPDLSDVSEPSLARSFERVSGRRTTSRIQLECDKVSGASETRPPPLPVFFSVESSSLGEYDFDLLSEFPTPPKKGWSCAGVAYHVRLIDSIHSSTPAAFAPQETGDWRPVLKVLPVTNPRSHL